MFCILLGLVQFPRRRACSRLWRSAALARALHMASGYVAPSEPGLFTFVSHCCSCACSASCWAAPSEPCWFSVIWRLVALVQVLHLAGASTAPSEPCLFSLFWYGALQHPFMFCISLVLVQLFRSLACSLLWYSATVVRAWHLAGQLLGSLIYSA